MDRESYEDPTLAHVINEHFIAIKVDRDERPDVDSRYQAAVSAISGQGGWPLTAVLTPDGRPFFGGTYFPKDDRYGSPGFERVLLTMANAWQTRREEVLESASSVMEAIEHGENFAGKRGQISLSLVEKLVASAVTQFDSALWRLWIATEVSPSLRPGPASRRRYQNTATRPPAALRSSRWNRWRTAACTTRLPAAFIATPWMSAGWCLTSRKCSTTMRDCWGTTCTPSRAFVDPAMAAVARDIMRWMNESLSDQQNGGFYASQDADITLDDDGDYFTWTRDEAAAVLNPQELAIASVYYDIGDVGDMHHNPAKNVLHVKFSLAEAAKRAAIAPENAEALLQSAKQKLYAARMQRQAPFIDRTIYTSWNALAVSAYFDAAQVLSLREPKDFALLYAQSDSQPGLEPRNRSGARNRLSRWRARDANSGSAGRLRFPRPRLPRCMDRHRRSSLLLGARLKSRRK